MTLWSVSRWYDAGLPLLSHNKRLISSKITLVRQMIISASTITVVGLWRSLEGPVARVSLCVSRHRVSVCLLARDAQAKLALIVAQCLSIHLSICPSVCLSATALVTRMYAALRVASHVDYRLVCVSVWRLCACACVDAPHFTCRPRPIYQRQPIQSVTMPCCADGDPIPLITWRKVRYIGCLRLTLHFPRFFATTYCITSCTTSPQQVVQHKVISNRRRATNPRRIEVVEFGR